MEGMASPSKKARKIAIAPTSNEPKETAMAPTSNKARKISNKKVATFVFLELETTGLPKSKNPDITELCMMAIPREQLELSLGGTTFPRVTSKLQFCVKPTREITTEAEELSGLSDEMLWKQPTFGTDDVSLIKGFLRRLPTPVCLVAYNGDNFDFPVLNDELRRCKGALPETLYCADSLTAFREIDKVDKYQTGYKLKELYERVMGSELSEKHKAEYKCIGVVELILKKYNDQFTTWADSNKTKFANAMVPLPRIKSYP